MSLDSAWNEFGHAWKFINRGAFLRWMLGTYFTSDEAVKWENKMRVQLYGPNGPKNAPRKHE